MARSATGGTAPTGTASHTGLVAGLSLEQKAALVSGGDLWHTRAVPEAGIPQIMLTDGPHGLRKAADERDQVGIGTSEPATCFPPAVALASSWDPEAVRRVGQAIADEARAAGVSVVLGPGINIKRSPLCGRNFEYASEDPLVSGVYGAAMVEGIQSRGVGACVKHFAVNNQETDRLRVSAEVDARTLHEIYLAGFEHVVTRARPYTVMCSYNRVNGTSASQNHWLLTELLRERWGFDGLVVSDWGAVADPVAAVAAGLDLEMPPTAAEPLLVAAVRSGELDEAVLDRAVERLLTLLDRTAGARREPPPVDAWAHHRIAAEVAAGCAVLLKNDGDLLPLDPDGTAPIAVVGEFARTPRYQGAGSSQVVPTRVDAPLDALRAAGGGAERVRFAPGFTLDGVPDEELVREAVQVSADAEAVLVFLGLPPEAESEGYDRTTIDLPADQLALLDAVHAVNRNVAVVLANGAAVSVVEWQGRARAVLEGWLLGQGGGTALAELLFGRVAPSGKLTETIPLRLADTPSHRYFPGGDGEVVHGEGMYVGYRHYDTADLPVAYPFGHGLGYTSFDYRDLDVRREPDGTHRVRFTLENTGARAGAEVAQVYLRELAPRRDRPAHQLAGFAKVPLGPGESAEVEIAVADRAFAHYAPRDGRWRVDAGDFEVRVGASSRDLRLRQTVSHPGDGWSRPLDAASTVAEWLDDPAGGPLLRAALDELDGLPPMLEDDDPALAAMARAMPLGRLVAFAPGFDRAAVDALVRASCTG